MSLWKREETGGNGKTQDAEFILSGGKLVTDTWSAIRVNCRSVTIKGGEIESLGDDIDYRSGLLDFSQHPDPTGISVYFRPLKIMESIRIKLPEGYCFYEYDSEMEIVASEIKYGDTYTIGKIVEGNEPKCICPNRCSLESLNGSCNACLSDVSGCTGEQWEPAQNITIFYKNTQNYSMPYAYYWGSKAIISWIGVPMTHVENDIWSVSVPADAVNITFYYYDNDSPTDLTIPTDGSNYYDGSTWTTYVCSHEKYNDGICDICGEVLEDMIVGYDENTKSATVTIKEAGTYTVIFADYDGERLANAELVPVIVSEAKAETATITKNFNLDKGDKIMLLQDMTDLVPLCKALVIE